MIITIITKITRNDKNNNRNNKKQYPKQQQVSVISKHLCPLSYQSYKHKNAQHTGNKTAKRFLKILSPNGSIVLGVFLQQSSLLSRSDGGVLSIKVNETSSKKPQWPEVISRGNLYIYNSKQDRQNNYEYIT